MVKKINNKVLLRLLKNNNVRIKVKKSFNDRLTIDNKSKCIEIELDKDYSIYPQIIGYVFGTKSDDINRLRNSINLIRSETTPDYLTLDESSINEFLTISLYNKIAFHFYVDVDCKYTFIIDINHYRILTNNCRYHEIFNHIYIIAYDLLVKYDLLKMYHENIKYSIKVDLLNTDKLKSRKICNIDISIDDVLALNKISEYTYLVYDK